MARTNNEVVGTLHCDVCNTVATLHQTKRGTKKGLLYKRCGCGCDQRTGEQIQKIWREKMTAREGYEHLKLEAEPVPEPEQEPEQEPVQEPIATEPEAKKRAKSKAPLLMSLVALCGGAMLVIRGVVKNG